MPLKRGTSEKTFKSNIHEFEGGHHFKHTERKFGKKDAIKQAVAVAYAEKRASRRAK